MVRRLAAEVGMQAPSPYKHFPSKRAVEAALIEQGPHGFGEAFQIAVALPHRWGAIQSLLHTYRAHAVANPARYRLVTAGPLRERIFRRAARSGPAKRSFSPPGTRRVTRLSSRSSMAWSSSSSMIVSPPERPRANLVRASRCSCARGRAPQLIRADPRRATAPGPQLLVTGSRVGGSRDRDRPPANCRCARCANVDRDSTRTPCLCASRSPSAPSEAAFPSPETPYQEGKSV